MKVIVKICPRDEPAFGIADVDWSRERLHTQREISRVSLVHQDKSRCELCNIRILRELDTYSGVCIIAWVVHCARCTWCFLPLLIHDECVKMLVPQSPKARRDVVVELPQFGAQDLSTDSFL